MQVDRSLRRCSIATTGVAALTVTTATQIETAAPGLDWLNKGVFISVAGRQAAGVIYETYLVA